MARELDWTIGNLRKIAKWEGGKIPQRGRPLTPSEQLRRWREGAEYERMLSGEITPTQYARYQNAMLKQVGVEV